MQENPRVFVSYSHQNAEKDNVILEFTNNLRLEGIDANIDLYEESPVEGWPRWMENQISKADFVLVVSSKSYYEKCYSELNAGKGVSWEVNIVYQHIYDSKSKNTKFIPIYFDKADEQYILTPLRAFTFYNVTEKEEFDKLYWHLRGVTKNQRPPLGKLRSLPQKAQRTMFFSSPIDVEKWNSARWKGILYLFSSEHPPVLGILYDNYSTAKSIFTEWKINSKDDFYDNFIKVDLITPPFPDNCWVYFDKDRSNGKGYFVHIGPNIDESLNRATASGINVEDLILTSISRYQWMNESADSKNRKQFQDITANKSGYFLMPIGIKDKEKAIEENNLIIDFKYAIKMRNITFKTGLEIEDNDLCKAVLNKVYK
ncbi:MAG: SEFIR domain-containing protein [Mobilitalea sp.]